MSTYNSEKYLKYSINSVLSQTYTNFEFIIVNDGSNDSSKNILDNFRSMDNRIKIIDNIYNIGLTKSLNLGIEECKGKYIARIDSDDIWFPNKLFSQVAYLNRNSSCKLLATNYLVFPSDSKIVNSNLKKNLNNIDLINEMLKRNCICHSSVIIDRKVLNQLDGYNENFIYAQDYDLWLRIMIKHQISLLPISLLLLRVSKDSISNKHYKKQRLFALKAKWKALKTLKKINTNFMYILGDIFVLIIPKFVLEKLRFLRNIIANSLN
jgi:glycosyltransferase involved in cell wall biosynthesis